MKRCNASCDIVEASVLCHHVKFKVSRIAVALPNLPLQLFVLMLHVLLQVFCFGADACRP